jgi:hypothetical protein
MTKPYHPNNLSLQPYGHLRVKLLAYLAMLLGVQFHIHGIPFGGRAVRVAVDKSPMTEGV